MVRTTSVGVVLAAALLVTGCSGGGPPPSPGPASATSARASATPSATPTPTRTGPLTTGPGVLPGEKPPVESPLATEYSSAGAYAFAGYFLSALSWAIATNDAALIAELSLPSCETCKNYINELTTLRAQHQVQRGGRPSVRNAHPVDGPFPVLADYAMEFTLDQSAAVLLPSNKRFPAHEGFRSVVLVSWINGRWRVVDQVSPS